MLWKGAHVIAVFFDITDRDHVRLLIKYSFIKDINFKKKSFERALIWIDHLKDSGCRAPILLIGTKIDHPLVEHKVNSTVSLIN